MMHAAAKDSTTCSLGVDPRVVLMATTWPWMAVQGFLHALMAYVT